MTLQIMLAILGLTCLVAAFLAYISLVDILKNGSGPGCIFREKSRHAAIFLSAISVIAICVSYLAITDILKDYAGYMLMLPDGQSVQSVLPGWAKCPLEWSWVRTGGFVIAFLQLAILVIMVKAKSYSRPDSGSTS